ncbi:MAG: helix-turn-helix transcriptional regulator [Flavisolibacter sp.]
MRIVQAKLFIDNSYSQSINLNQITGEAFLSKFHFIRTFKLIYVYTPNQYLQRVRIEKAKLYLKGTMSIEDICHSVGFVSVPSFISLFKRRLGQTPEAFRKAYLEKRKQSESNPFKFIPACFSGI